MKVKALATIGLAGTISVCPNIAKEQNGEHFLEGNIIAGVEFPSEKWVDFYDLVVLIDLERTPTIIYVVGSKIPAYVELNNGIKAYKLKNGMYFQIELDNKNLEEVKDMFRVLGGIHNV